MTIPKRTLLVLCLLLLFARMSSAEGYFWRFNTGSDVMSWKALNASSDRNSEGLTLVRQDDPFWLVSSQNLNIVSDSLYIEFRLKAPETYLIAYVIVKTRDNRSWQEEFSLGLPDVFHVYRINLQRGNRTGAPIDSVAFAFGKVDRVSFDFIRIFRPSPLQLLEIYWSDLWDVKLAGATTVNFVSTPLIAEYSFLAPLYGLLVLIALCILAWRRPILTASITNALIIACVVSGILFALRMDYNWYMQWRADRASLGRGNVDEQISRVEGSGAYDFAQRVKQVIPAGSTVRIFAGILEGKIKYYLLPLKVSQSAKYIVVFKNPSISFDPGERVLKSNNEVLAHNVQFVRAFGSEGFLYASSEVAPR